MNFEEQDYCRTDLIVIQGSPFCNLACDYCYLADKDSTARMNERTLRRIVREVLDSGLIARPTSIVWHAGEPLALPVSFYENAFGIIREEDSENLLNHHVQTNATTLNLKYLDLLKEYSVQVGVSIDGPCDIHDSHRVDRKGRGSFEKTYRGLRLLQEHGVDPHTIAVITEGALSNIDRVLEFFEELDVSLIAFNIEELEGSNQSSSLDSHSEGKLQEFFQKLHRIHIDPSNNIKVREFERVYRQILCTSPAGEEKFVNTNELVRPFGILSFDYLGGISTFSPELLGQPNSEFGNFTWGNVNENSLADVLENPHFVNFYNGVRDGLSNCANTCKFFPYCGGGSPGNKLYENGDLASTETFYCRSSLQIPFQIALEHLEAESLCV